MTKDTSQTLKKLQETELEILDEISDLCTKHDITWWLDSGTALGARRHHGFIPWDDDIDIGMLRKDYDLFCKLAPKELPPEYSFHNARLENNFAPLFSKIWKEGTKFTTQETLDANCSQGIFVDIFPYDYINTSIKGKLAKKKMIYAQRLSYIYHSPNVKVPGKGFVGQIQKLLCLAAHQIISKVVSKKFIIAIFDNACKTCQPCSTVISSAYAYTPNIKIESLIPPKFVSFEGKKYPCPNQLDQYLKLKYGNWEKLPEEKDRITHLPLSVKF